MAFLSGVGNRHAIAKEAFGFAERHVDIQAYRVSVSLGSALLRQVRPGFLHLMQRLGFPQNHGWIGAAEVVPAKETRQNPGQTQPALRLTPKGVKGLRPILQARPFRVYVAFSNRIHLNNSPVFKLQVKEPATMIVPPLKRSAQGLKSPRNKRPDISSFLLKDIWP